MAVPRTGHLVTAARFARRHPGALVAVVAVALVVVVAGRDLPLPGQDRTGPAADGGPAVPAGGDRDGPDLDQPGDGTGAPAGATEGSTAADGGGGGGAAGGSGVAGGSGGDRGEEVPSGAGAGGEGPSGSATAPADVDRPRPPVDMGQVPPGGDARAVARWWAASYTAHAGAEPGADLARRLAPRTTRALRAELAGTPPAASYGPPVTVDGVSAREPAADGSVWVTVETPGALVVYDLALVRAGGVWRVDEVHRL